MSFQLKTYSIKDWVVLGRTYFNPPRKIIDTLINEARIVHVVEGRSKLYAASKFTNLSSGDTVIMKSDNFINNWLAEDREGPNEVIVFQLTSDLLQDLYENQVPDFFLTKKARQVFPAEKVESSRLLNDFFTNLAYYLDHPQLMSEDILKIKIKELIYILINTDKKGSIRAIFGALFQSNEYAFQEVIQTHLFEDLNLDDLAFLTGLSLSSFKRKFSEIYRTSPNKYIISKRLEKAKLFLRRRDLRVSEIAYECGYADVGYFTKTFQKHFKTSPSEYREKLLS